MTVPDNQTFNPSAHLSIADVAVDDAKNPADQDQGVKDNPFSRGVDLYVGKTGSKSLCSIRYVGLPQCKGNGPRSSVSVC